jgi:hypothetical protein
LLKLVGSFKICANLIPSTDKDYNVPKEKPLSEYHIKRIYECEEGGRNTIYWHKNETKIAEEKRKAEETYSIEFQSVLSLNRLIYQKSKFIHFPHPFNNVLNSRSITCSTILK